MKPFDSGKFSRYLLRPDSWVYAVLSAIYLAVYWPSISSPGLLVGVDFLVPPTRPNIALWGFLYPTVPFGLGFYNATGWGQYGSLLTWLSMVLAGDSRVLAQRFLLSSVLFSSFTMFYFLRKGLRIPIPFSAVGSLVYAYGPIPDNNFGTGGIWEYAFFPLTVLLLLEITKGKGGLKVVLSFVVVTSMMISFGAHLAALLPVLFVTFLVVELSHKEHRWSHLIRVLKPLALAGILMVLTNLFIASTAWEVLQRTGTGAAGLASRISSEQFFSTYQPYSVLSSLTLSPWITWSPAPAAGVFLPILAFGFLLSKRWRRRSWASFALAEVALLVSDVAFLVSVAHHNPLVPFLLDTIPFFAVYWDSFGPATLIAFLLSGLIAITSAELEESSKALLARLGRMKIRRSATAEGSTKWQSKRALMVALVVLVPLFVYAPIFTPWMQACSQHYCRGATTIANAPAQYDEALQWLMGQEAGSWFRYVLLPTPHTSNAVFGYAEANTLAPVPPIYPINSRFVAAAIADLASGNTRHWGRLMGVAGVKYAVVLSNVSEPLPAAWYVQGIPRFEVNLGIPVGDPSLYLRLLRNQTDFLLAYHQPGISIFRNLDFRPLVQAYANAAIIYGDIVDASRFRDLINSTLLLQPSQHAQASQVRVDNSDFVDYSPMQLAMNSLIANPPSDGLYSAPLQGGQGWRRVSIQTSQLPPSITAGWDPYLNDGSPFFEAVGVADLKTWLTYAANESYDVMAQVLCSAQSTGFASLSVGDQLFGLAVPTRGATTPRLAWFDLGTYNASTNGAILTLRNLNGYSAIGRIVLVNHNLLARAASDTWLSLRESHPAYYLSSPPYVTFGAELRPIPGYNFSKIQNWSGGNPWSTVTAKISGGKLVVDANGTVANPERQQVVAVYKPVPLYNLTRKSYLSFSVKASEPKLSLVIFGYNGSTAQVGRGSSFEAVPHQWNSVNLSLEGFPPQAGWINFGIYASRPNESVSFELRDVEVRQGVGETATFNVPTTSSADYKVRLVPLDGEIRSSNLTLNSGGIVSPDTSSGATWTVSRLVSDQLGAVIRFSGNGTFGVVIYPIAATRNATTLVHSTSSDETSSSILTEITSQSAPVYLFLSEAFNPTWVAKTTAQSVSSILAEGFGNAFILSGLFTDPVTVRLVFGNTLPLRITQASLLGFASALFAIGLIAAEERTGVPSCLAKKVWRAVRSTIGRRKSHV
jgi:hypothetical protein